MERMKGRIATQEKRMKTLKAKIGGKEARIKDYSDSGSKEEDLDNNDKEKVNRNTQLMESVVVPMETKSRMEKRESKKSTSKYKMVMKKVIAWMREGISYRIRRLTGYGRSEYIYYIRTSCVLDVLSIHCYYIIM
ncbi:hypothetical protein QAD02_021138 [Eretmocerus hayati]|uniref:Uncharacterized protein n=1 Tax=Eretmocerus hayati TaxID=131215 RepID=A0ACC2PP03_9HYME|nr:hypothetical protein QAD02_021138 [Eretmocerus hayati]